MKKDLDKLFSKSIQTYYFLLLIVVIIKLLGGNYFAIVYTNRTVNIINDFITTWKLENIWYAITLCVNVYITLSISCNDNSKRMKKYCLLLFPLIMIIQYSKNFTGFFAIIIDYLYLYFLSIMYVKIKHLHTEKQCRNNYIAIMILNTLAQMFSMIIRDQSLAKVTDIFLCNIYIKH